MLSFKFLMTKIRKVKNDLIYLPEAKKSLSQFKKRITTITSKEYII